MSVVSIEAGQSSGSGVILTADGDILTNSQLVAGAGTDPVTVIFSSGDSGEATVVGADPRTDLAIVKVDGAPDLVPAVFGDSDVTQPGDEVQLIGAPAASQASVASGTVRDPTRTVNGLSMMEVDVVAEAGSSGRPLINADGEVIGIYIGATTTASGSAEGGLAIPSSIASRVAGQLIGGEQASHPYLGLVLDDTAAAGGAQVQEVAPGSPAEQAGLAPGDVITSVGDRPVADADDLLSLVLSGGVGDEVAVTYTRDGSEQTVTVTLVQAPAG